MVLGLFGKLQIAVPELREEKKLTAFKEKLYSDANGDILALKGSVNAPGLDESGWDLLSSLMKPSRGDRINAEQALSHPFLS